jgi:hypothetical protein
MSREITLATWSDPEIGGLPVPPAGRKDYGYRLTHGVSVRVRVYSEHRMVQVPIPDPVTGARRWAEIGEWNIESNDADAFKAKAIVITRREPIPFPSVPVYHVWLRTEASPCFPHR